MSLAYVRHHYQVPAKRGGHIRLFYGDRWITGRIVDATHNLIIAVDAEWGFSKCLRLYVHPKDKQLEYVP